MTEFRKLPGRLSGAMSPAAALFAIVAAIADVTPAYAEADRVLPTPFKSAEPVQEMPVSGEFATLPPGSRLPSSEDCAARVQRSPWEPRPQNAAANRTTGSTGPKIDGADDYFNARYASRIDGDFAGTTDEIIQWGACKWGFDVDLTRARAIQESNWQQSQLGDKTDSASACATIGQTAPCWQSYGLLQVKGTVHEETYPLAKDSTSFNVDYSLAWLRACYEGAFGHWLGNGYRAGDEWGCVGAWFSGNWYDGAARHYIEGVKQHLSKRDWKRDQF
ncbi:MAG TPA: hypothetical protein VH835_08915 [Dongiaceae bacterium]